MPMTSRNTVSDQTPLLCRAISNTVTKLDTPSAPLRPRVAPWQPPSSHGLPRQCRLPPRPPRERVARFHTATPKTIEVFASSDGDSGRRDDGDHGDPLRVGRTRASGGAIVSEERGDLPTAVASSEIHAPLKASASRFLAPFRLGRVLQQGTEVGRTPEVAGSSPGGGLPEVRGATAAAPSREGQERLSVRSSPSPASAPRRGTTQHAGNRLPLVARVGRRRHRSGVTCYGS